MYGPYPTALVETRLRESVSALRLIGNSADLEEALKTPPTAVPAAFVLRSERGDTPNDYTNEFNQNVRVAVQVVLWVRNFSGTAGSGARTEMDALQKSVRTALLNWSAGTEFEPLNLDAERDESFRGGELVCQTIFRSSYRLQTGVTP